MRNRGRARKSMCLAVMLAVAAMGVLLATTSFAQESSNGSISGEVTDTSGAVIPNATVQITNAGTHAQRTVKTGAQGDFFVPNLPPGAYTLRISKEGFRTVTVEAFELNIGQIAHQSVKLPVGSTTEQIVVNVDAAPLLQTQSGDVGQVIGDKQVTELPLNGRNIAQLAVLSAGVSQDNEVQRSGQGAGVGGATTQYGNRNEYVQVDGGRDSSTNWVIDGVYVRSLRFNNLSMQPSVDTIQEFALLRSSFSAEYGQGQSVITMVTRSGSNKVHGTMYEFLRNDLIDARNYFATVASIPEKPEYRRNQFGATLGGPVMRDKVFFFTAYEGLRTVQGIPKLATVPTTTIRGGNFSALLSSQWPIDPTTGAAFPGGVIPTSRISQYGSVIASTFPDPNTTGNYNYAITKSFVDNYDQVMGRSDQTLSGKHSMFERYIWFDGQQHNPDSALADRAFPQSGQNVSIGDTYLFSTNLINEVRLGYNRAVAFVQPISLDGKNWVQLAGLQNLQGSVNPIDWGRPLTTISGYTGPSEGGITQGARENIFSLGDTVSLIVGHHTLRTGFQGQYRQFRQLTENTPRGSLTFNGSLTGSAFADFLLGYCSTCAGALGDSTSHYTDHYLAAFANDTWKMTGALTLNLGVRWEYASPFVEKDGLEANFDPGTQKIGFHKLPANIPTSILPYIIQQNDFFRAGIINPVYTNFGPRIGIAYQLDPKTTVRSGFGIFFDNIDGNELQFTRMIPPLYINYSTNNQYTTNLFPSLSNVTFNAQTPMPAPFAIDENYKTPYTYQYNLSVQRALTNNTVLELAYTGSSSHRLTKRYNQNEAIQFGNPLVYPYPQYQNGMLTTTNRAGANFNGISVRVQRQAAHGLYYLANYQYSKNIDNASGEIDANDTAYSRNFRADRARSAWDVRHRAVGSIGWDLPFGKDRKWLHEPGVARALAGGWQAQSIITLMSGLYLTPYSTTVCNCGSNVPQRVNPGTGPLYPSKHTVTNWYNPTAFTTAAKYYQGTMGRSLIEGPPLKQVDFSAIRNFPVVHERLSGQFRAEFFDIFNHPILGPPDSDISDSTAGAISTASNPRDIQVALKLIW